MDEDDFQHHADLIHEVVLMAAVITMAAVLMAAVVVTGCAVAIHVEAEPGQVRHAVTAQQPAASTTLDGDSK